MVLEWLFFQKIKKFTLRCWERNQSSYANKMSYYAEIAQIWKAIRLTNIKLGKLLFAFTTGNFLELFLENFDQSQAGLKKKSVYI